LAYYRHTYENIDGESLLWAAQRSLSRGDSLARKVIVVFSDGMPQSYPERDETLSNHLLDVVSRVEEAGILVIGVGIESDHVKEFYSNYLICRDLSVFAEVFFAAYRRLLLQTPLRV